MAMLGTHRVDEGVRGNLNTIPGWAGLNNPWVPHDAADAHLEYIYVDLQRNPEKYTGAYRLRSAVQLDEHQFPYSHVDVELWMQCGGVMGLGFWAC